MFLMDCNTKGHVSVLFKKPMAIVISKLPSSWTGAQNHVSGNLLINRKSLTRNKIANTKRHSILS